MATLAARLQRSIRTPKSIPLKTEKKFTATATESMGLRARRIHESQFTPREIGLTALKTPGQNASLTTCRCWIADTALRSSCWITSTPKSTETGNIGTTPEGSPLGSPDACRAVGTAVGKNPVAVLIPCHRVIREDGMPGGYHWGLARKLALLGCESVGRCRSDQSSQEPIVL